jgi:GTP cyclohydrolase I
VDLPRIEAAVREILAAVGEDPEREGLRATPARVARMYAEIFSGLAEDPGQHLVPTFEADHDELVLVRDIAIYSVCEHHLLPWSGTAHVAYIPNEDGRITGLSKLVRLVEGYAKRPQVQERLTSRRLLTPWCACSAREGCSLSSRRSTCACRCGVSKSPVQSQ